MPSTYSPDLRIELIQDGEQSGTWGDTTNSNLGTIIESAISGLATVSVLSANQALTALNGVADESRCAAVELTTLTTAPFSIYVPPVTKLYVVINSTAYAATVYCSTIIGNTTAAGTGVTIPAGKTVLLRADGTNIVEQLNYIAGNFSVNGALAIGGNITVGGTTTLSADPTLALQAATKQYVDSAATGSSPPGALIMWPTDIAPSGWLLCNGQAVSRTTYAALFAVIGTTFGAGDTTTTFNLPDYRDRMPIGASTIATSIGATGGYRDSTLVAHTHSASTGVAGSHNHGWTGQAGDGWPDGPGDRIAAGNVNSYVRYTQVLNAGDHTHSVSVSTEGISGVDRNLPPYIGINFIIKA